MDDPEVYVNMPDSALPSALPKGWTVSHPADPLTVVGPEGDLRISYFSVLLGGSVDDQVRSAWRQLDPAFDKPVRYQAEMPSTEGWDSVMQIVYDMPANESRLALAIVRMLGERAYINLIDGTKAAFSRRLAQISEIGKAWRPAGFREPSLAGTEPKSFGDAERNAMSDFIRSAMRQLRIPGVAVAIVQNGETVYAEGFGVRRAGNNDPVTPTTRFMIGSSTKPLTTLMMAKLVDMGCFAWTTPVAEVLPGFSLSDAEVTSKLEMRHTVSASTGMPRRDVDLLFRFQGIRPENRIAEMKAMLPTTGFGETFQYSNYLVAAGGYAAAHSFAPGSSLAEAYERAMGQLVFEPLGMGQTSILCNDSPEEAAPHGPDLEGNSVPIDPAMERFADAVAPAGSVWSTILDMMKYVR
jgi:CubicO group peptidase (beta-lactamase class C family)